MFVFVDEKKTSLAMFKNRTSVSTSIFHCSCTLVWFTRILPDGVIVMFVSVFLWCVISATNFGYAWLYSGIAEVAALFGHCHDLVSACIFVHACVCVFLSHAPPFVVMFLLKPCSASTLRASDSAP